MEVNRRNFPEILKDNDEVYLLHFLAVVESVDELCCVEITKVPTHFNFRIAPSVPKYTNHILKEIIYFNNLYKIHMNMGKSIKTSSTINFDITSEE